MGDTDEDKYEVLQKIGMALFSSHPLLVLYYIPTD